MTHIEPFINNLYNNSQNGIPPNTASQCFCLGISLYIIYGEYYVTHEHDEQSNIKTYTLN